MRGQGPARRGPGLRSRVGKSKKVVKRRGFPMPFLGERNFSGGRLGSPGSATAGRVWGCLGERPRGAGGSRVGSLEV